MKTPMDSPALVEISAHYPEWMEGRVPKRVRIIAPDPSEQVPATLPGAWRPKVGELLDAYVNSHGAVSVIPPDGEKMYGVVRAEFEVVTWHNWPLPITDEWLGKSGFKWHEFERSGGKHWLLWLDCALVQPDGRAVFGEDLGLELCFGNPVAVERDGEEPWYFCWLRADTARRYSRFLHVRHLRWQHELAAMIEGLTGRKWVPADAINGALVSPETAAGYRAEKDRLDRRLLRESPKWAEIEKDDTRGGALPGHMEAAIKSGDFK